MRLLVALTWPNWGLGKLQDGLAEERSVEPSRMLPWAVGTGQVSPQEPGAESGASGVTEGLEGQEK